MLFLVPAYGVQAAASTLVVLDPPRTGCQEKVLQCLARDMPAWDLYGPCNPATLARDLQYLVTTGGYCLKKLGLFDMFPRTAHFETAALLQP